MKTKLVLLFLTVTLIQSCSFDTPEDYFDWTTLNINKYSNMGSGDFEQMISLQSVNAMYEIIDGEYVATKNYEAHVKTARIDAIDIDIEKVKSLQPTEDTKNLIEASLAVYAYVRSMYETEYGKIAKLMDDKVDQEIIDQAILEFEAKNVDELFNKIDALHKIAIPYAENNGIEVKLY